MSSGRTEAIQPGGSRARSEGALIGIGFTSPPTACFPALEICHLCGFACASAHLCCVSHHALAVSRLTAAAQRDAGIPRLRKQGTATQLVVDGAPFLMLGGELGNSTASSVAEMRPVWPKLQAMHLNTVLAPVYWELIEPEEGRYEFASVDSLIARRARAPHAPRAPLVRQLEEQHVVVRAGVCEDQPGALPAHGIDSRHRSGDSLSVLVGQLGDGRTRVPRAHAAHSRDRRRAAHRAHGAGGERDRNDPDRARPQRARRLALCAAGAAALLAYLQGHRDALVPELRTLWDARGNRISGTWEEVFGPGPSTEELFMAWYFARYTQEVTAAGKAEYPLPMYANAALIRPGYAPGRYVSAGPLPHLLDVWRAAAPSLDFIAPDIYFPNFTEWSGKYVRSGNPLFVPENGLSAQTAMNALYAFGAHDAIGFSPFAIESADPATAPLARSYALLEQLAPVILANQGRGTMVGVMPPTAFDGTVNDSSQQVRLGDFTLTVSFQGHGPGCVGTQPAVDSSSRSRRMSF